MVIYIPTKVYLYNFVIVWMMQKFDFQQQNEVQSGYTYQVYVVRVLQKNICKINYVSRRSSLPKQKVLGERFFSYIAIGQSCLTIFLDWNFDYYLFRYFKNDNVGNSTGIYQKYLKSNFLLCLAPLPINHAYRNVR